VFKYGHPCHVVNFDCGLHQFSPLAICGCQLPLLSDVSAGRRNTLALSDDDCFWQSPQSIPGMLPIPSGDVVFLPHYDPH
jgi:hypothetical protein